MNAARAVSAAALLAAALSACAAPGSLTGMPLTGSWGGEHIGLVLTPTGGTLEYDCAKGTIDEPVVVRQRGFEAIGRHSPGTGGPERIGDAVRSDPARYHGTIRGDRMTLNIVTPRAALGPFTLEADRQPVLLRCL